MCVVYSDDIFHGCLINSMKTVFLNQRPYTTQKLTSKTHRNYFYGVYIPFSPFISSTLMCSCHLNTLVKVVSSSIV